MNKGRTIKWGLLALMAMALVIQPLLGQATGRGEVRGVVRDQNQAVIPGADVTIVNLDTNVTSTTITSDVGVYFIGAVQIGYYRMRIEMPGFNTWTTEFNLQAGGTATIDAVLQVGDIATEIVVTDSVSEVSIDRLEVADVKDFARIQQLPLNGREVGTLFALTPGVEGAAGGARVLGSKVGSLEITLDGVSMVDRFGGGLRARVMPRVDMIQEFRVETVGSDSRFSRPSTVTMVSRSGTNELHGSAYYTHRNSTLGVARARGQTGKAPTLHRHEFGVTAGGPFWLGNFYDGRDKTFWFFNYEGLRTNRTQRNNYRYTPMAEWWQGDFSELVDSGGDPLTIYDPLTTQPDGTRDPFQNNQIPPDRRREFSKRLEAEVAKPNIDVNPAFGENFIYYYPLKDNTNQFTFKADQVLSERDNLAVRWTRSTNNYGYKGGRYGNPDPFANIEEPGSSSRSDATINNVSVNWNRAISASFLNELLVGVHRVWKSSGTYADFRNAADDFGLPNPFGVTGWPTMWVDCGGVPWRACEFDGDNIKDEPQTLATLEDNITWVKGDHVLQFGGKFKREHVNVREMQQAAGSHEVGGLGWTGLYDIEQDRSVSRTGHGMASMFLGLGGYFSVNYNRGFFYYRQTETGLYVNDKWKVNPKLTVNLGLRWDAWTPYKEKHDRLSTVDTSAFTDNKNEMVVVTPFSSLPENTGVPQGVLNAWTDRGLSWVTADSVGYPGHLYKPDWNNLEPRVGVSYLLTDKTVLRGSYGEYYWTMPLSQLLQSARGNPPFNARFETNPDNQPGNADPTGDRWFYTWMNTPKASDYIDQIEVDTAEGAPLPSSPRGVLVFDGRNWRDSKARTWHATLEHEIMRNTALRLSYTGVQGRDLEQRYTINDPVTRFNYITQTGENYPSGRAADVLRPNKNWSASAINKTGFSNTHAGQVELERRFSDGVGFQVFYVYTRSLTTTDTGGFSSGGTSINSTGGGAQTPSYNNLYWYPNPVGEYFTSAPSEEELLKMAYFNSTNIPPHRIRFNGILDLPFGQGKRFGGDVPGALNQVIGGWQVAFIGDWRSGEWESIDASLGVFRDYIISPGDRPEVTIYNQRQTLWFAGDFDPTECKAGDCAALAQLVPENRSQRAVHKFGTSFNNRIPLELNDGSTVDTDVFSGHYWPFAKGTFMGPRAWNLDLSIFKHFYINEDMKIRFTADFFNFFNHPNDPSPNSTTGLVNHGTQPNAARVLQLALRFDF